MKHNTTSRSRACQQCKKKRIKCDLSSPKCQRCIDSCLSCSGPILGLLIHQYPASSIRPKTKHTQIQTFCTPASSRPSKPKHIDLTFIPNSASSRPSKLKHIGLTFIPSTSPRHQKPLNHTPIQHIPTSQLDEDILLTNFLSTFSQPPSCLTWHSHLPPLRHSRAITSSTRALSLAYAAVQLHNPSLQHTAYTYYGASLRHHGASLSPLNVKTALPTTILLTYFELVSARSRDAWMLHSAAAEGLFDLLEAEDELLNHLWFIVRSCAVIRAFVTGKYRRVPRRKMWRRCGLVSDLLVRLIEVQGELGVAKGVDLGGTVREVKEMWGEFVRRAGVSGYELFTGRSLFAGSAAGELFAGSAEEIPEELREVEVALCAAHFHSVAMLVWRRDPGMVKMLLYGREVGEEEGLGEVSTALSSFEQSVVDKQITHHGAQILQFMTILQQQSVGCACLRMILPITVIRRCSPDIGQAVLAEQMFREWAGRESMPGLAVIAFGS